MGDLGLEHRSPDPCRSVGKQSACNARELGSIPGSERSPGEGNGNPLQYSCLENPMDRGAWQATVHGAARVRHNLMIKPPLQTLRSFKWNKGSFSSAQAPRESRELVLLQRCLEMLMLMVEHRLWEPRMKRKRNSFLSKPKNLFNILDTMSSKDSDFPCVRWGDVLERFEHPVPGLYFEQLAACPGVAGRVPGAACTCAQKGQSCPQGGLQGGWWISQLPRAWGPALLRAPKLWVYFLTQGSSCGLRPFGRLARCLLTPGLFSPEAALPPLRSAGVRGVRVPRLPQGRGSKPGAGWARGWDSGPCLRDAEPDPLLARSREWRVVRKIGRNNPCPLNCLGLIRRLIMYSVCLGWKWVIASLLI